MIRINKKRPFSPANSVRVNQIATEVDRIYRTHSNLKKLRDMIASGTMTEELYDFINMDGSLEHLLLGLPRPSDEISCEALQAQQLEIIDAQLEGLVQEFKNILARWWDALKEWFLDWWDLNRSIRFRLNAKLSQFNLNPTTLGNVDRFEAAQGNVYHKPYWARMCIACTELNKIMLNIPTSDLSKWVASNVPKINQCIGEFGQYIESTDNRFNIPKLVKPKYDQTLTTLGAARWRVQLLGTYIKTAVDILGNEIEFRKTFSNLESAFKNASIEDKNALSFLRQLTMRAKTDCLVVGRGIERVLSVFAKTK